MKAQSVARNTTFLTGAYILQKIFAFIYFTLIARYIGPHDVGKYAFAVSLTTLLAIFIDLGLTSVMIRELSKFQEKVREYGRVILSSKIILGGIMYIIALSIARLLHKDGETIMMVAYTGVAMVLDSFSLTLWGILRSRHNLFHEGISTILNQVIITIVGLFGLYLKFPLVVLAIALAAGSAFSFIYALLINLKHGYISIIPEFRLKSLYLQLKEAWAFALSGIFTRVYSYLDQVLLSLLISNAVLGWYSVAYKITFAFQFIPSAFAAAIYPAMSAARKENPGRFAKLFEKSMFFLGLVSIPLATGIFVIAPIAVQYFYGAQFSQSILPLQILIVSLPAVFLSFPVGSALNSSNKQHINTLNLGITMVINIILNIILIPRYQHVGASIAATISLYYLFISNLWFVGSVTDYQRRELAVKMAGVIFSSIIMAIACYGLISIPVNLLITVIGGAGIFLICIYAFRIVTWRETIALWKDISKGKAVEESL